MVDMVPVRELPYGPAAMRRINRPERWQHPTIATYPNLPPCFFRGVHRWVAVQFRADRLWNRGSQRWAGRGQEIEKVLLLPESSLLLMTLDMVKPATELIALSKLVL